MSSVSIRVESPLQASMAEQAVAMAKQLEAASQAAPDGKVLSRLEQLAVDQGREFTRKSLEAALQSEAEADLTLAAEKSLKELAGYFANQSSHLNYKDRLAEGRSIGSGAVEGAAKNLIGRRLKQTGARWRVRRVNRMATLCSAFYSDHWDAYWNSIQNQTLESKHAPHWPQGCSVIQTRLSLTAAIFVVIRYAAM